MVHEEEKEEQQEWSSGFRELDFVVAELGRAHPHHRAGLEVTESDNEDGQDATPAKAARRKAAKQILWGDTWRQVGEQKKKGSRASVFRLPGHLP